MNKNSDLMSDIRPQPLARSCGACGHFAIQDETTRAGYCEYQIPSPKPFWAEAKPWTSEWSVMFCETWKPKPATDTARILARAMSVEEVEEVRIKARVTVLLSPERVRTIIMLADEIRAKSEKTP